MSVHVEATYGATKKYIAAGLETFNRQHMTRSPPKSFALTAKENGKARGGLMAEGVGEWIVVSLLWVEDGFRRRGHGRLGLWVQGAAGAAEAEEGAAVALDPHRLTDPSGSLDSG